MELWEGYTYASEKSWSRRVVRTDLGARSALLQKGVPQSLCPESELRGQRVLDLTQITGDLKSTQVKCWDLNIAAQIRGV